MSKLSHRRAHRLIQAEQLSAPERHALAEHLTGCEACRHYMTMHAHLLQKLQLAPVRPWPAPALRSNLRQRLHRQDRRDQIMKPMQALAGVVTLLVLVVIGWMLFNTVSQQEPEPAAAVVTTAPLTIANTLCDARDSHCLEIRFDGSNCAVAGPMDTQPATYTFIFVNESEENARMEASRIHEGKTLQDLEEHSRNWRNGYAPTWVSRLFLWETVVVPGKMVTFERKLQEPGVYGVICTRVPQYIVFGGGFTIEE